MIIYRAILEGSTVWVGSSSNLESRRAGLVNFLGTGFKLSVLERVSEDRRYEREQYWIDYFTAYNEPLQNKARAHPAPKLPPKERKEVVKIERTRGAGTSPMWWKATRGEGRRRPLRKNTIKFLLAYA